MRAMVLERPGSPLVRRELPLPRPRRGQLLVRVEACGVCRTDLHVVDGELERPRLPLVPGHEIVGRVVGVGEGVEGWQEGERVGVPWLASTCGQCRYCQEGRENLCDTPEFTGYTVDGGYAEYTVADQRYCFKLPGDVAAAEAAPLLCAGLIGYRSYRMAGEFTSAGIYGFGGAAHIVTQIAVRQGKRLFAFTRPGDEAGQRFARALGCVWAGGSDELPPEPLDAAIIFAPVGSLVVAALRAVRKGGTVVCGGIHMSEIPPFPYSLLWGERVVRSVANLTRQDGIELLDLAMAIPIRTEVQPFPLEAANEALAALRSGRVVGAAVLVV
ncbi:MAG: zinc-dependent alcohol dehydrogenase family protein [Thermoanaerobaculaceae bacterium]|nr:zinc-dependent alcohol dehydrogenase family protein [Thermoanaerobaculaceae bacterium]